MRINTALYIGLCLVLVAACQNNADIRAENRLLMADLQESNLLLEQYNKLITTKSEQIYYLKCRESKSLKNRIPPLLDGCDSLCTTINNLLLNPPKKIPINLLDSYIGLSDSIERFANSQTFWSDNDYQLARTALDSLTINEIHPEILLLRLKNDLLICKAALLDYLLFYSICKHKTGRFLAINIYYQKFEGQHWLTLETNVPDGTDSISKSLVINKFTKDNKAFQTDYFLQEASEDTCLGQIFIDSLPPAKYHIEGTIILKRASTYKQKTLFNDTTTAYIHLPFVHDFRVP